MAEMGSRPQDRDRDVEEKNIDYRTIPMNIDEVPVGKRGGGASGVGNFSGKGMENDFQADSRFSSSTSSRKKSISRTGRGDEYDDDFGASLLHGQGSEVAYNKQDDKSSSHTQIGSGKGRVQRGGKNVDNYDDEFSSGNDPHIRLDLAD